MGAINSSLDSLNYVWQTINPILNRLVVAVIILFLGFIVGKIIGKLIERGLKEVSLDKGLKKAINLKVSLEKGISSFASFFIYLVAIIMALDSLGLTSSVLIMISAAIIVVIVISFILAIKDYVPNIIAGIRIKNKGFIEIGDYVKVKDIEGRVIKVNLNETELETKNKDIIFVPNSMFVKEEVYKRKRKKTS